MNWAAVIWFILMVVFIILEANTVAIVSLWFVVGAICGLVASLLGAQLWLQILLFSVVSLLLLISLRPITKKYFTPKLVKTNVDSVIGMEGIVITQINNLEAVGTVKLGGMEWSARSSSGEIIPQGTKIRADRIEGVKVFVSLTEVAVQ